MDIKKYLQSKWDFKKTTEQNVISFNNGKEKAKKARRNLIIFSVIVIALSILFHNPMLAFALMIGAIAFGSYQEFTTVAGYYNGIIHLTSTKVAVCYGNALKFKIGDISSGTITWGSEYTSGILLESPCLRRLSDSSFIVCGNSNNDQPKAIVCTVSGTVVTVGTPVAYGTLGSGGTTAHSVAIFSSTKVCIIWEEYVPATYTMKYIVGDITSGTTLTFGSAANVVTDCGNGTRQTVAFSSTKLAVVYPDPVAGKTRVIVGDVSSTTVTWGSTADMLATVENVSGLEILSSTKLVCAYQSSTDKLSVICGTVSGTTMTFGSEVNVSASNTTSLAPSRVISVLDSTNFVVNYKQSSKFYAKVGTVGTTDITLGTEYKSLDEGAGYFFSDMLDSTHYIFCVYLDSDSHSQAIIGTVSFVVAPTVTTQNASSITQTTATGNGNITDQGGETPSAWGICVCLASHGDPDTGDTVVAGSGAGGTGAFTASVTGLTANTAYHFRAYATNSAGTSYGATVDVTTAAIPTLTANYGSFVLTGQAALFHKIRKMTAGLGSFVLTGQNITFNKVLHIVCSVGSFTLTGQAAILRSIKKMICAVGEYTLTGQDALFHKTLHLIGGLGSFALTGFDVILFKGRILACEVGTFVLTGQDALFHRITKMTAEVGTFVLTGYNAALYKGYKLVCGMGSYVLTGQDVAFKKILRMTLAVGSFTMTGYDVALYAIRRMTASVGSFVLTGQDAIFKKILHMTCVVGDFTLTGFDAILHRTLRMIADVGMFTLLGQDALLKKTLRMICGVGNFVLTGFAATLTGHGDWLWKRTPKDDGAGWTITPKN